MPEVNICGKTSRKPLKMWWMQAAHFAWGKGVGFFNLVNLANIIAVQKKATGDRFF